MYDDVIFNLFFPITRNKLRVEQTQIMQVNKCTNKFRCICIDSDGKALEA